MNGFQIVFVLLCAAMAMGTAIALARGRIAPWSGVLWALLWAGAAVAIARPGITVTLARFLGIGRGADLVLYCSVVAMALGFLGVHARLQQLRRELTAVVRELALRDAVAAKRSGADGAGER